MSLTTACNANSPDAVECVKQCLAVVSYSCEPGPNNIEPQQCTGFISKEPLYKQACGITNMEEIWRNSDAPTISSVDAAMRAHCDDPRYFYTQDCQCLNGAQLPQTQDMFKTAPASVENVPVCWFSPCLVPWSMVTPRIQTGQCPATTCSVVFNLSQNSGNIFLGSALATCTPGDSVSQSNYVIAGLVVVILLMIFIVVEVFTRK